MTAMKNKIISSKEKSKRRKISKYLYCLDYVTPNLLPVYETYVNHNPLKNEEVYVPTFTNTMANEPRIFQLKILENDVLGYSNAYEKSINERLNNINFMFAYFQIIASIYMEKFPKRSLQDLDGIISLFNTLLQKTEDIYINNTIHIILKLYMTCRMNADMNNNKYRKINQVILYPNTWALIKSSRYSPFPRFLQLDLQAYILRYVNEVIYNRAINDLKEFIALYSSHPTKRIIIHFQLPTAHFLHNLSTENLFSCQNLNWTKEHAKVLEQYNLGTYVKNNITIEDKEQYCISQNELKVPESYAIIEVCEKESTHEICNNIATNTEYLEGNWKFDNVKIQSCRGLFNNRLWIASLCGDSLRTKVDFSAYILKCSCFDEVLNLDPAKQYIQNAIEPLKSSIFVKTFLKDLTKTFLKTLFYFPI